MVYTPVQKELEPGGGAYVALPYIPLLHSPLLPDAPAQKKKYKRTLQPITYSISTLPFSVVTD